MAEEKQYVNLDPAKPDELKELKAARAGRIIKVKAKVTPAEPGVRVHFMLQVRAGNVGPSVDQANFSAARLAHLRARARALPGVAHKSSLTDDSGVARTTFKLSAFGGDEFEVSAHVHGKEGRAKKLGTVDKYVVWRRLYYQVSRFKAGTKHESRGGGVLAAIPTLNWATVKTEYEARKHNIELVDDSSVDLITRRCEVLEHESDYHDYQRSAREGYDPKREPVTMRAVLVKQIAESYERDLADIYDVSENVPFLVTLTGLDLWFDDSKELTHDWLVAGRWRRDPSDGWKNVDRAYVRATGPSTIEITLKKIPKLHFFDLLRRAQVKLRIRCLANSMNGMSWHNSIWLANENMHRGLRTADAKLQTAIHETGHYVGMARAGQTTYYTGKGHQGPHCSQGLSPVDRAGASYRGKAGTCVMFGESAPTRKKEFCAVCDESLRLVSIAPKTMPAEW